MIEVYALFPQSIMFGVSMNETGGIEIFLGLFAVSIGKDDCNEH